MKLQTSGSAVAEFRADLGMYDVPTGGGGGRALIDAEPDYIDPSDIGPQHNIDPSQTVAQIAFRGNPAGYDAYRRAQIAGDMEAQYALLGGTPAALGPIVIPGHNRDMLSNKRRYLICPGYPRHDSTCSCVLTRNGNARGTTTPEQARMALGGCEAPA